MSKVIISFLVTPFAVVLNGWVFSLLWLWFIVPVFELPVLSTGQSIGVAMVVSFATSQYIKQDDDDFSRRMVYLFIKPVIVILFGLVAKQFI